MTLEATPRVEVKLKATRICYLSGEPCFKFILYATLRNSKKPVIFLKDGFTDVDDLQSINSDQIVQCFDDESGEQLHVLPQGTQPSFLQLEPNRYDYVCFTTSSTPRPYHLPFDPSSLRPSKKYSIRFKSTTSITHWPTSMQFSLNSIPGVSSISLSGTDVPTPSTTKIAWDVVGANDTVFFETRRAPPKTPKITVSMSAPSTLSLSSHSPFTYTLTFSTDAPGPITVLAERERVEFDKDVIILDATSGSRLAPDQIDVNNDSAWEREDFLRIDGTYTEHREIDVTLRLWEDLRALKIGEEYVLRSLGVTWRWWTEDTIDEVMTYVGDSRSVHGGLGETEAIEIAGGGEQRFKVVE